MCSGRQDEAAQLDLQEGTQEFTSVAKEECEKKVENCSWGKTKEQIEANKRLEADKQEKLRKEQERQAKIKQREEERQAAIKKREEEKQREAAALAEAKQKRADEKRGKAAALAEDRERRRTDAEEARNAAAEADQRNKEYFASCLRKGDLAHAEESRQEGGWSKQYVRLEVNKALAYLVKAHIFPPATEQCDMAYQVYNLYRWVGGLCVPTRSTSPKEQAREGSCYCE